MRRGSYSDALVDYVQLLQTNDNEELSRMVRYRMGRAYEELGSYPEASRMYRQVRDDPASHAHLRRVCQRQISLIDYRRGRFEAVLSLPSTEDPYLLILTGFAAITPAGWQRAREQLLRAYPSFPPQGQRLLDEILTRIGASPALRYKRRGAAFFWNLLPGGGSAYNGDWSGAGFYALSVTSLAGATVDITDWPRYGYALAAAGCYWAGIRAAGPERKRLNAALLKAHLASIRADYAPDIFWSFAHPAIY